MKINRLIDSPHLSKEDFMDLFYLKNVEKDYLAYYMRDIHPSPIDLLLSILNRLGHNGLAPVTPDKIYEVVCQNTEEIEQQLLETFYFSGRSDLSSIEYPKFDKLSLRQKLSRVMTSEEVNSYFLKRDLIVIFKLIYRGKKK